MPAPYAKSCRAAAATTLGKSRELAKTSQREVAAHASRLIIMPVTRRYDLRCEFRARAQARPDIATSCADEHELATRCDKRLHIGPYFIIYCRLSAYFSRPPPRFHDDNAEPRAALLGTRRPPCRSSATPPFFIFDAR